MEWPLIVLVVAVALGSLALALSIIYAVFKSYEGTLRPLAGLLEGSRFEAGWLPRLTIEGLYRGRPARFSIKPGGKNSPPEFRISLSCGAPLAFRICREGVGEKIGKALGLLTDVKVGDPELDRQLLFSCDKAQRFAGWMARPEVRQRVASLLLSEGVASLRLQDGFVRATYLLRRRDREKTKPESVRAVLPELEALARSSEGLL